MGVKKPIKTYYGKHYQAVQAYNEIVALKQTSTVQRYLNDIDGLNAYTGMTDHHLINIILNCIPSRLCLVIAHYENLYANPVEWKKKLLEMDVATIEFQHKDRGTRGREKEKDQRKKRSFEERT